MIKEVTVPDIGNFSEVEVIEVPVKAGAKVDKEDTLITLETEKASMDIPSPYSGIIKDLKIKVGDKVSKGTLILTIETEETEKKVEQKAPEKEVKTDIPKAAPKKEEAPKKEPAKNELKDVTVPDIGNFTQVEIIEVSVQEGDKIKKEDTLITLETEKASMDIPSPYAGEIKKLKVKKGDKVSKGDVILSIMAESAAQPKAEPKKVTKAEPAPQVESKAAPKAEAAKTVSAPVTQGPVYAGPATRRLARELGVDLTQVPGTGRKNRIVTKDIHDYVKAKLQLVQSGGGGLGIEKMPQIDFTQFGEIEEKPLGRIKKWTAKNLHRNWVSIPHVTQFDEADITELEVFREENKKEAAAQGIKLTPLVFIMKACVSALKHFPQFNASLSANGETLIYKKYFHIGFAVDTPNGLVVPVVRDVDNKGLFDLAKEIVLMSDKAREGKLKNDEMQGSCFTITSLGGIGGTGFTPIINAPDLAILGVSKASIKPVFVNETWVPRKMMPLSLSYDHRVIDGAEAAKFTVHIASQLQDIRKLLL